MQDKTLAFEEPTLLYMPHCDRDLYERIFASNPGRQRLERVFLIGNELEAYVTAYAYTILPPPKESQTNRTLFTDEATKNWNRKLDISSEYVRPTLHCNRELRRPDDNDPPPVPYLESYPLPRHDVFYTAFQGTSMQIVAVDSAPPEYWDRKPEELGKVESDSKSSDDTATTAEIAQDDNAAADTKTV